MENPHLRQKEILIARVAASAERLSASVNAINNEIEALTSHPLVFEANAMGEIWAGYSRSLANSFSALPPRQSATAADVAAAEEEADAAESAAAAAEARLRALEDARVRALQKQREVNDAAAAAATGGEAAGTRGRRRKSSAYDSTAASRMRAASRPRAAR